MRGRPGVSGQRHPDRLSDVTGFGSNPGALRARLFVPENLPRHAALVVVLHGCTQSAAGYDHGSGWSQLATQEGFAVLFLDLDKFKDVNDQYGHEAGNEVLRAVAGEIRNAVRASDVAARYGGDEFVVILTRTDLQGGARVAEALRAGIEGIGRRLGYPPGLITVSVGLAEFDPRVPSEGDLLVSADRALYRAKAAGRNAVA